MLRAVIFDFDGLILDTELPEYTAWSEVYESHGHRLDIDLWRLGVGTRDGFDPYGHLEGLMGRALDRDRVRQTRRTRTAEIVAGIALLPGISNLLTEAARLGLGVAIASSSDYADVYPHLERHQIASAFAAVVCAATDGLPAKPDPALYVKALRVLSVDASEAIAFEDSRNGVSAAKAAGIACVAVPNEITKGMDLSHADLIVPTLAGVSLEDLTTRLRI